MFCEKCGCFGLLSFYMTEECLEINLTVFSDFHRDLTLMIVTERVECCFEMCYFQNL